MKWKIIDIFFVVLLLLEFLMGLFVLFQEKSCLRFIIWLLIVLGHSIIGKHSLSINDSTEKMRIDYFELKLTVEMLLHFSYCFKESTEKVVVSVS
ncbi:hypothetical protein DIX60_01915 [Streptococcus iniae]|uniref:hypothetical protein n=1 Tax=Streptococcus iniae TaxID=1346 RepID=UPI0002D82D33|nr:hypothetical protein [Streptococcus iniae]ESR08682.1 hypothetical protein IUSA1_11225 [Streptococcus iniae IUSA1]OHX26245.1 hypothetical protein BKX95_11465 [Streptococcus iniae]RLV28427.1 hypothetical protein DIX60_01915 [Streptococcus iniae]